MMTRPGYLVLTCMLVAGCNEPEPDATGAQKTPETRPVDNCAHTSLASQSMKQRRITRNAVYARHGRSFKSADLSAHFDSQDWYTADPDYTDDRLTPKDSACVKRAKLWEASLGVIWKGSEDLNGDGRQDELFLLANSRHLISGQEDTVCDEPGPCPATLVVNDQTAPLGLYWHEGAYFGEKDARIVDIDNDDNHREILIRQRTGWHSDPPYSNHIFTLVGTTLRSHTLAAQNYDDGALVLQSDGRIGLRDGDCRFQTTAWYSLKNGDLKKGKTDKKLRKGSSQFPLNPDGSYDCPG